MTDAFERMFGRYLDGLFKGKEGMIIPIRETNYVIKREDNKVTVLGAYNPKTETGYDPIPDPEGLSDYLDDQLRQDASMVYPVDFEPMPEEQIELFPKEKPVEELPDDVKERLEILEKIEQRLKFFQDLGIDFILRKKK